MKIDLNKTIEQIEGSIWDKPDYDSHLVRTCHLLRKKILKELEIEDLRILIDQNIALEILIPIAIKELEINILAEGDFYPGDLFKAVLDSDKAYWISRMNQHSKIKDLYL